MAAFIIYIIRWAVCLTLLYSLFGLFLKRETLHGMNRIVLLAILVASMVLPLCQIETGRKNIVTQSREKIEYQIANVQNPLSDDIKRITITNPDNGVKYTHIPIRDDVNTGDKYVCRATDYDYFKYVNDETITYVKDGKSHKDTIRIYQTCLVFPPLGKNVKEAYFGPVKDEGRYSNTFDVNKIPRKGRVITK